jgi:ribosomal protein S18 acetylase RimI-like enzyme
VPTSGIKIRHADHRDSEPLAHLAVSSFLHTFAAANHPEDIQSYVDQAFSLAQVRAELEDSDSTFLLAVRDDAMLGYAKLRRAEAAQCITGPSPVELQRIYANPAYIGKGVGKALLQASIRQAREGQFSTLWLGVWEHNPQAIAFYHYMGFETVGSHEFMLGQDRQTDLIMQRVLT